jgi:GTP cyclohydrolase I
LSKFSISEEISQQLRNKNVPFNSNDNISGYIDGSELEDIQNELTSKFEEVLRTLIIDVDNDPNAKETALRLSKMYLHEVMAGRYYPAPIATAFPNTGYTGMIVVRAELRSLCAHHHQVMKGVAYIGVIPKFKVLGLSKYIRIAQWVARRGQIQEELCEQIATEIAKAAETEDVAVYLAMTHDCVENRGVGAYSSLTQTTVLYGEFDKADVKKEFMDNVQLQEMKTGAR